MNIESKRSYSPKAKSVTQANEPIEINFKYGYYAFASGLSFGPYIYGMYEVLAGTVENNPDRINRGAYFMFGSVFSTCMLGTFALREAIKGIRVSAPRLQINKTPNEIVVQHQKKN